MKRVRFSAGNPKHRTIVTRIKIFMILKLKLELF